MLRIRGGHPDISWMDDLIVDERTIPLKTLFFFFFLYMPCLPWMTIMDKFGVGVTIHHQLPPCP